RMNAGQPTGTIRVLYRNHRGETRVRTILPRGIWFGGTTYHEGSQWFLTAFDAEGETSRHFALSGILAWDDEAIANYQALEAEHALRLAAEAENERLRG